MFPPFTGIHTAINCFVNQWLIQPCVTSRCNSVFREVSSGVEHSPHTRRVASSKLALPTILFIALAGCGGGGDAPVAQPTIPPTTPVAPVAPPIAQPIVPVAAPVAQTEPVPTVALTFDYYGSTYRTAFPMLRARGLIGTFFVDPGTVDNGESTTAELSEMRSAGWSIQAYSGVNMANLLADSGPNAVIARLNNIKATMAAKGFDISSIAPVSRAWNSQLRDLTAGIFSGVRANNDTSAWQSYPVIDPMLFTKGGTASLSGADTVASLGEQIDSLQASRGLWIVVVHKVGDDADPVFSVKSAVMAGFLDRLAADAKAGKVRVVTFEKALIPEYRAKSETTSGL